MQGRGALSAGPEGVAGGRRIDSRDGHHCYLLNHTTEAVSANTLAKIQHMIADRETDFPLQRSTGEGDKEEETNDSDSCGRICYFCINAACLSV